MSNTSEEDMWKIAVQKIEEIESLTDLENRTTDLYYLKFCYPDNDGDSHIIGGYVQMKKENCIQSVFKFNCPSINERLYKLEVYLQSRKINLTHFHRCKRISYLLQKNYLEKEQYYIPHEK